MAKRKKTIWDNLERQTLLARIEVYDESIWIENDQAGARYEVEPAGLAAALAGAQGGTGLLPRGTLFVNGARIGLWNDSHVWQVQLSGELLRVPMPPLVIVGEGRLYRLYAVKQYPGPGERLFRAPMPNIHGNGQVCAGSVVFPECSPATMRDALKLIVSESGFNRDLGSGVVGGEVGLLELWQQWDREEREDFPLELLVATKWKIEEVMDGAFGEHE